MDHQLKNRYVTHKNVQHGQNGPHGPNAPKLVDQALELVPEGVHTVHSKQLQLVDQGNLKRQNHVMKTHAYQTPNGPIGPNGQSAVKPVVEVPKLSTEPVEYPEKPGS